MKNAFTLAEVLITLGIIGVVAAMTLPTLIQKNHQTVAINQLKRSYAVLSTAVERGKADYGDLGDWGFIGDYSDKLNPDDADSKVNARELPYQFFKKYLMPYLPVHDDLFTTLEEIGYTEPVKYRDGRNLVPLNTKIHYIGLNDGSTIMPNINSSTEVDDDGNKKVLGYTFLVDINGKKRPNILGKDNFYLELALANNAKLRFSGSGYRISFDTKRVTYNTITREKLLEYCTTTGTACGALIHADGWQIKKDYKW